MDVIALLCPAIRSAGRYDSQSDWVLRAAQEKVCGASREERGDATIRRGNDAASDREAIVTGAEKVWMWRVGKRDLTTPFLNSNARAAAS